VAGGGAEGVGVSDPRPNPVLHNFFVRVLLYSAAIAFLIWVLYEALEQRVVSPGFMKKVAAALGVYGTVAQAYLAADEGARRRENESKKKRRRRLRGRDHGEFVAWVFLIVSVAGIAATEFSGLD
jgi:hypothetical protein